MDPEIRYTQNGDVHLAFQVIGTGAIGGPSPASHRQTDGFALILFAVEIARPGMSADPPPNALAPSDTAGT